MKGMSLTRSINAYDAPQPEGGYAQAVEAMGVTRTLYVSGQIPLNRRGELPSDFAGQCRQVWANIAAQLEAAGMAMKTIVKVTTFLSSRDHAAENSVIRQEVLGKHSPALTVVICEIYDPAWLLEIEVIAAE